MRRAGTTATAMLQTKRSIQGGVNTSLAVRNSIRLPQSLSSCHTASTHGSCSVVVETFCSYAQQVMGLTPTLKLSAWFALVAYALQHSLPSSATPQLPTHPSHQPPSCGLETTIQQPLCWKPFCNNVFHGMKEQSQGNSCLLMMLHS